MSTTKRNVEDQLRLDGIVLDIQYYSPLLLTAGSSTATHDGDGVRRTRSVPIGHTRAPSRGYRRVVSDYQPADVPLQTDYESVRRLVQENRCCLPTRTTGLWRRTGNTRTGIAVRSIFQDPLTSAS